jgi:hypothetical protein
MPNETITASGPPTQYSSGEIAPEAIDNFSAEAL